MSVEESKKVEGEEKESVSEQIEEEEEDEESRGYTKIDTISKENISIPDIKKLKNANYSTVESVAYTSKETLLQIKGFSEMKVDKIQDAAYKLLANEMTFQTAMNIYKKQQDIIKISTGSSKLDKLLGGGIETGTITEIYGAFSTGKTQICHQLSVMCQFPIQSGGAEGCVLYIDTAGTFRPNRISQIVNRYGMDTNDILDNISFARAYTTEHQMKLLKEIHGLMTESHYKLIIIDSGTGLFRTEYRGRGTIKSRDALLSEYFGELLKLCDIFHVAVVITNQVVTVHNGAAFGPPHIPYGDEVVAHSSTTRISLRKACKNTRIAKIVASCALPVDETVFVITDYGIDDE